MHILCTLTPDFLEGASVTFPREWELTFVPYKSEALYSALADADCLLASSLQPLRQELLEKGKRLRLVHTIGVGYDKIDLVYAKSRGIYICNGRGTNGVAVAEHAVALMLAGLRRTSYHERRVFQGEFREAMRQNTWEGVHQLGSRRVGLIGLGENGSATARILQGFGAQVYYYKRHRAEEELERQLHVQYLPLQQLLSTCNVISLHVPSTPETRGLIGKEAFALMQKDTLLVNVARGEIIDTQALVEALLSGSIFGAALDTTSPEPPDAGHPLLNLPEEARNRLTLTPHIAGVTAESKEAALNTVIENIRRVERGERPNNVVNGYMGESAGL